MEDIMDRLFALIESLSFNGCLTKEEEVDFEKIKKDYDIAKEAAYILHCPKCGEEIKF